MYSAAQQLAQNLSCWEDAVAAVPLAGGLTNTNFKVQYRNVDYVVRIGADIPEHGIMRFNELNASRAAYQAGISPEVIHSERDALVIRFIEGQTLCAGDISQPQMLQRVLPLLKRCHRQVAAHLKAGSLSFWVFHINRNYAASLRQVNSSYCQTLQQLMSINEQLEAAVGRVNISFCHNDMLAANFIDDSHQLWLIDWDYAGFNSPLFDLSNLSANNDLHFEQECWLLENYYEKPLTEQLWRSFSAMKCASLQREMMWSMVSEHYSKLDFDYRQYTTENKRRFESAYTVFKDIAGV